MMRIGLAIFAVGFAWGTPGMAQSVAETADAYMAQATQARLQAMQYLGDGDDADGENTQGDDIDIPTLVGALRNLEQAQQVLLHAIQYGAEQDRDLVAYLSDHHDRLAPLIARLYHLPTDTNIFGPAHPDGVISSVQAQMIAPEIAPALLQDILNLRQVLENLNAARALGQAAPPELGLVHSALERGQAWFLQRMNTDPPQFDQFQFDATALAIDAAVAVSLGAFTENLQRTTPPEINRFTNRPRIGPGDDPAPLPVTGWAQARPNQGGILVYTIPGAVVITPFGGLVRYVGAPSGSEGQTLILQIDRDHFIILAGLDQVFVGAGDIAAQGAPLGVMPPARVPIENVITLAQQEGGIIGQETLYLDIRRGARAVDPSLWFAINNQR